MDNTPTVELATTTTAASVVVIALAAYGSWTLGGKVVRKITNRRAAKNVLTVVE